MFHFLNQPKKNGLNYHNWPNLFECHWLKENNEIKMLNYEIMLNDLIYIQLLNRL